MSFPFQNVFPPWFRKGPLQSLLKAAFGFSDFWIGLEMKALLDKFRHNGSPIKSSPDVDLDLFRFFVFQCCDCPKSDKTLQSFPPSWFLHVA